MIGFLVSLCGLLWPSVDAPAPSSRGAASQPDALAPGDPTAGGAPPEVVSLPEEARAGSYVPGTGVVLARNDSGELGFSAFSYVRYLNQLALDESHRDAFGRTRSLDPRQDFQLQKVTLNFKGWILDPAFRALFYVWTANTSQGQAAQVVVAGNLSYRFNRHFSLAGGIGSLPSTRSTNYTFPNWLKVDHRTIADEFFRASYTTGVWAWGEIVPGLAYQMAAGNAGVKYRGWFLEGEYYLRWIDDFDVTGAVPVLAAVRSRLPDPGLDDAAPAPAHALSRLFADLR